MLEKHVLRVFDAVSDRFRPSTPNPIHIHSPEPCFSLTKPNEYCQRQCRGCDEICELLRWAEVQRRRDSACEGSSPPRIIHSSYRELDLCAVVSRCDTCRVIRRAFLLEQITGQDADRLAHPKNQWPIYAVLRLASSGDSALLLSVRAPDEPLFSAAVRLSSRPRPLLPHDPTRGGARLRADLGELRRLIHDCHRNHECSSRYRWSRRNPAWLLRILPDNRAQLVERPPAPVDYVVLSYSWGNPATMPAAEWARIKGAATKTVNGRPVPERLSPFLIWELPETMQDAIAITASLGFFYIWIDNVCIPKGTNWDTEAALMHEVYGNAALTLVASSSTKATDRMLHDRLAWLHRSKACKLRGLWLRNTQMPLDQVRLQPPVAQRGWTLQEEYLSPRSLYWTGQRWYWSCAERQVAELSELGELDCPPPPPPAAPPGSDAAAGSSCPQRFLELCRTGDERRLHEAWLDIVEAYTRRDLVAPKDRFLAIAGLAVRFYNAKAGSSSGGGSSGDGDDNDDDDDAAAVTVTEEYLAGLWRDDFARHLAWSVVSAVDPSQNLQHIAPSWSWASLPLCVQTRTARAFKPSGHFRFIAVRQVVPPSHPLQSPAGSEDSTDRGQLVEERGRNVKVVEVEGRFRRFVSDRAREVPWGALERKRGGGGGGDRVGFDFSAFPGERIYARNRADGRVLSKDAHAGEVVGQLDYLPVPLPGCTGGGEGSTPAPYLPEGREKELVCLELGELAMLLLVPDRRGDRPESSYRRVGVAVGYGSRKGFFYGCETRRICLV